ncbi:hypothetical protein ACIBAG_27735 [Streptomyces sp. NPDC051243]|uniref:hypothetical protein n=1 Tax=Streptomyces sp. NPDC051243 TaxID=3365646 RepID=UPI0037984061
MSSPKDDERAFARIEQRLADEDPALARRIDALNTRFTESGRDDRSTDRRDLGPVTGHADEEDVTGQVLEGGEGRSWTVKVTVALAVLAAVGLILTAILSAPGGGERQSPQPYGLAPPAASHALDGRLGSAVP